MANLPMPSGDPMASFRQGFGLTDNLMKQLLERRALKQGHEEFLDKQKQLERHFQAQLGLSKAAAGRAAQDAMDAHQAALNKLDPTYEAKQYEALENYFRNRGASPATGGAPVVEQNAAPEEQMPQTNMPTEEAGQGMGMFNPEGLSQIQNAEIERQQQGNQMPQEPLQQIAPTSRQQGMYPGVDLELMKQHPILRAMFKHKYKVDPLKEEVLHGPARDAADLEKLRSQVGEQSPVYQNAKASYDAQLEQKKDLRDIRARTKEGLKPGEKQFFDKQTGLPLGKEIPLSAKERESEEGNILFNELYPLVYKGASPFSGQGSIRRLEKAAANYKSDPKARKLFDDFLLADKMMAATAVNEASTLKSGHTNQTYKMLKESLEAQDIPKTIKKLIKEYQIPSSAQLRAAMRYQKELSDARKKARKSTPATQKLFYNPEMQAQQEENGNDLSKMSNEELQAMLGGG